MKLDNQIKPQKCTRQKNRELTSTLKKSKRQRNGKRKTKKFGKRNNTIQLKNKRDQNNPEKSWLMNKYRIMKPLSKKQSEL